MENYAHHVIAWLAVHFLVTIKKNNNPLDSIAMGITLIIFVRH